MKNADVSFTSTNISALADEMVDAGDNLTTFDGGDHLINTWVGDCGRRKFMIQGTGESVTLLVVG